MTENKRFENKLRMVIDTEKKFGGRVLTPEEIVVLLNNFHEENKQLRTLNYVNKEAVRLNCIESVQIGGQDVNCSNINWKLIYELYGNMIDFYYDGG